MNRQPRQCGFTFIELMIVVVMVAILAVLAAPSFNATIEKYRTKGVAENLYTDLVNAKSETIKSGSTVFFKLVPGANWCYGLSTGAACDCSTTPASCVLGTEKRVVDHTEYKGLTLTSDLTSNEVSFSPRNSLPNGSGTITLTHDNGKVIKVVINPIGRIGLCSDDYSGYGGC